PSPPDGFLPVDSRTLNYTPKWGVWLGCSLRQRRHPIPPCPRRVIPPVFDIDQAILLLELEPPFDKRTVQLARRRMAKRWHPDIAPPGRQHEHQRHLHALNEPGDELD